jgi:hypothetical protein
MIFSSIFDASYADVHSPRSGFARPRKTLRVEMGLLSTLKRLLMESNAEVTIFFIWWPFQTYGAGNNKEIGLILQRGESFKNQQINIEHNIPLFDCYKQAVVVCCNVVLRWMNTIKPINCIYSEQNWSKIGHFLVFKRMEGFREKLSTENVN